MKLATFTAGGAPELGLVMAEGMIPLSRLRPALGGDMISLIAGWPELEREVRALPLISASDRGPHRWSRHSSPGGP